MSQSGFTIGHSNHPRERFLDLLSLHGIDVVCDVRSKPWSRLNPWFNRDELKQTLRAHGIGYLFFGRELGARSDDPSCYEHGRVQYDLLARTETFRQGLSRIRNGLRKGFRIALMCAEKEPLDCHRTILVARHLAAAGIDIRHIHGDGRLEAHAEALSRLARMTGIPEDDMFRSPEDLQADSYRRQEGRIAYRLERTSPG